MQFYNGKEYMERDLHVLNEKGQQEVLRIMDQDFMLLHEGNINAPEDWKEVCNTVSLFMPLEQLMLTADADVIGIVNAKNGSKYKPRKTNKF